MNGTCMTCKEAYPDRPYWDFTVCVAEVPRYAYYISGVVLIGVAFVLISILKFVQFRYGTLQAELSTCKGVAVGIAFLCVAVIVFLVSVIAFVDISNMTLYIMLGGTGACFIIGSCLVAKFAGLEHEEEDHNEDADKGVANREHIRNLIAKGRRKDLLFWLSPKDIDECREMFKKKCIQ